MRGKVDYKAYRGAETDPYGVYQIQILSKLPAGNIMIENLFDAGKTEIEKIETAIEPDFVYPLLRGRDINRWKAQPSIYALMVRDPEKRIGYDEKWLKINSPKTYSYLKGFEDILQKRANFQKYFDNTQAPFYTMYNIGIYTFAPFKTVWQRMGKELKAAVLSEFSNEEIGRKVIIPAGTTSFIPCQNEEEAYYLCALMNSSPSRLAIQSFSPAGRSFGAPSILNHLKIPKYDPLNSVHRELFQLSLKAHKLAQASKKEELKEVEDQIDLTAAKLWNLTPKELNEIKRSPKELG